jgi:uncharacterized protein (TIGR04255 family)
MPAPRHLANAPIREALIDIAVKLPKDANLALLRTLRDRVAADYPQNSELGHAELELVLSDERNRITQTKTALGYRCQTKDGNKIVQFRLNGFTYNWLRPYQTWEDLRDTAQGLWRAYQEVTKPVSVTRVALRYINNVEIPLPFKDFREYLATPPNIPAELPQKVTRFLSRVSIVQETSAFSAIITQAFEGIVGGAKNVTVILDIDTSKRADFANDEEIRQALEGLHIFKNDIFFNSLTEEAVRLFE